MTDFARDGHAVVPLFDPATVRAALGDIAAHVDRVAEALYAPTEAGCPDAPMGTRLDQVWAKERSLAQLFRGTICSDAHRGPRLQALAHSPGLKRAAEALSGQALGEVIVRVRASIPALAEQRHDWHSDVAIDDGTSCGRVRVTAWIPLTDAGPESGGLEVVSGRRDAPFPHQRGKCFAIDEAELEGLPRAQPFCPAGSALLLDRFTPHRSLPPGPEARFALVVWMKGAE